MKYNPELLCLSCPRHRNFLEPKSEGMCCEAFPGGIPEEILDMDVIHDKPVEGDNGLQYISEDDWRSEFDDKRAKEHEKEYKKKYG